MYAPPQGGAPPPQQLPVSQNWGPHIGPPTAPQYAQQQPPAGYQAPPQQYQAPPQEYAPQQQQQAYAPQQQQPAYGAPPPQQ
jgi:hypothetical protein